MNAAITCRRRLRRRRRDASRNSLIKDILACAPAAVFLYAHRLEFTQTGWQLNTVHNLLTQPNQTCIRVIL